MSYKIVTVEYHRQEMQNAHDRNARRIEQQLDAMDCALSTWSDNCMGSYHREAIRVLELGAANGFSGPADYVPCLFEGERRVNARLVEGRFGWSWLLAPDEEKKFGRRFIPDGENSRIQKQLGLNQRNALVPIKRYFKTICSFVGAPITYISVEQRGNDEA